MRWTWEYGVILVADVVCNALYRAARLLWWPPLRRSVAPQIGQSATTVVNGAVIIVADIGGVATDVEGARDFAAKILMMADIAESQRREMASYVH